MIPAGALVAWEATSPRGRVTLTGRVVVEVPARHSPWRCVPADFCGRVCFRGRMRAEPSYLVIVEAGEERRRYNNDPRLYWPRRVREMAPVNQEEASHGR